MFENAVGKVISPLGELSVLPAPIFKHDCSHCKWLYSRSVKREGAGGRGFADFYVCEASKLHWSTIIGRYSSEGPDYSSCSICELKIEPPFVGTFMRRYLEQATFVYLQSLVTQRSPIEIFAELDHEKSREEVRRIIEAEKELGLYKE